jgi:hypothetical protein
MIEKKINHSKINQLFPKKLDVQHDFQLEIVCENLCIDESKFVFQFKIQPCPNQISNHFQK